MVKKMVKIMLMEMVMVKVKVIVMEMVWVSVIVKVKAQVKVKAKVIMIQWLLLVRYPCYRPNPVAASIITANSRFLKMQMQM